MCCVQTKGALAAAAAASAVAAQVARGRGRAALARGAFVSAAAPGYVTPGSEGIYSMCVVLLFLIYPLFSFDFGGLGVISSLVGVLFLYLTRLFVQGLALQH